MANGLDQTYERIRSLVQKLHPDAVATSDVRGVPRIRSFRFVRDGHDNYILTFIIDELSSITHRCLEALKSGDSFLVGTTEKNSVFQVSLNHELVEALKTSKPDRSNGSHHVEVARFNRGFWLSALRPVVLLCPP